MKTLELVSSLRLVEGVRKLTFVASTPVAFSPGQFMQFDLALHGERFRRSYSIASAPVRDPALEFVVSGVRDGRGTQVLFELRTGDKVSASGPHGHFFFPDNPLARVVMIATGTGIAPFRSMLRARVCGPDVREIHLVVGADARKAVPFLDELATLADADERIRLHERYTRDAPTGRVQDVLASLAADPATDTVLVSGNPGMVDSVVSMLTGSGFRDEDIHRERYIAGA